MNDRHNQPQSFDRIGQLLRQSGQRPQPNSEQTSEALQQVRAAWQARLASDEQRTPVARRGPRPAIAWIAMAASLMAIAVTVVFNLPARPVDDSLGLGIELLAGTVMQQSSAEASNPMKPDSTIAAGDALQTRTDGRLALTLPGGASLRLDHDTRIEFVSAQTIQLSQGRVYLDHQDHHDSPLQIVTPAGSFTHIGTQYQVSVDLQTAKLMVRTGRVRMDSGEQQQTLHAGQALAVTADGQISTQTVTASDPAWDWVQSIAPAMSLDNASLASYLDWVSRESGYGLEWDNSEYAIAAAETQLSGSIGSMTPLASLEVVMMTTDFEAEIRGNSLHLSRRND